jgi:hypothetical protein
MSLLGFAAVLRKGPTTELLEEDIQERARNL